MFANLRKPLIVGASFAGVVVLLSVLFHLWLGVVIDWWQVAQYALMFGGIGAFVMVVTSKSINTEPPPELRNRAVRHSMASSAQPIPWQRSPVLWIGVFSLTGVGLILVLT